MASTNLKPGSVQGYQSETEKSQPNTLKRQPNPDWSKNDLLRLLSYFEGELQARDITIATLKAEKAKQLLYQAKYGRFGLGDPFLALQRDAEGKSDTGFDEAAIKSMYDNQLAQLENLIATQRKAQLKMREQLGNSEKRFHKVCTELEDEKKKHAHDTAQGDDVTYMLEKERERLKAEIDFERSQNKKMEKDLKKTLASLEEERANAARHKQVAIMLIKERKNLIERLVAENQLRDDMESALTDGKSRMQSMAEGLAEESKKSLKMEAALERQSSKFDGEREALKVRLQEEEKTTNFLRTEVGRLSQQLEALQHQVRGDGTSGSGSQHLRASSNSPARMSSPARPPSVSPQPSTVGGSTQPPVSPNVNVSLPQVKSSSSTQGTPSGPGPRQGLGGYARPGGAGRGYSTPHQATGPYSTGGQPNSQHGTRMMEMGRVGSSSPDREVIYRPGGAQQAQERKPGVGLLSTNSSAQPGRVGTAGRTEVTTGHGARINIQPSSGTTVTTTQHGGGKVSFHVSPSGAPPGGPARRVGGAGPVGASGASPNPPSVAPMGRGVPPPIPPNKPNFVPPAASKPSLPPKGNVMGTYGDALEKFGPMVGSNRQQPGSRAVQIPVRVINSGSGSGDTTGQSGNPSTGSSGVASVRTQVRDTSPSAVRKNSQYVVTTSTVCDAANVSATLPDVVGTGTSLEFLGPEMANLQQLLASMSTEPASSSLPMTAHTSSSVSISSTTSLQTLPSTVLSTPGPALSTGKASSTFSQEPNNNSLLSTPSSASSASIPGVQTVSKSVSESKVAIPVVHQQSANLHISESVSTFISTSKGGFAKETLSETAVGSSNVGWQSADRLPISLQYHPTVITAQPLPSGSVLAPSTGVGGPTVGVVIPTVAQFSSDAKEIRLSKQEWASLDAPSTNKHSPTAASTSSPSQVVVHNVPIHVSLAPSLNLPTSVQTVGASPSQTVSNTKSVMSPVSPAGLRLIADLEGSLVHKASAQGDIPGLQALLRIKAVDCNLALKDGTTPVHCAVEYNQEGCLKLLLENGGKPSCFKDDRTTPLHVAAQRGYIGCLRLLLAKGAAVNLAAASQETPLLLAVKSGHHQSCQLLLRHGANVLFAGKDGLSSIHHAVKKGNLDMLRILLDRLKLAGVSKGSDTAQQLVHVTDSTGWTLAHMAASLQAHDCLVMLCENLPLDFDIADNLGRSARDLASPACKSILGEFGRPSSPSLKVAVELRYILENTTVSNVKMGSMQVGPDIGWQTMEKRLRATLNAYLTQLDTGLRTRRITRMEAETADKDRGNNAGFDMNREFSLGLTMANIKQFEMGFYKWTPGMQTDTSPYLILCNNEHKRVTITIDDSDFMCELIAFDVLHPVSSINNYLRLVEQNKSVIFYGPAGSGKSYLAHKLAQSIAAQEISRGRKPSIYQLTLQPGFTYSKFLTYLKQRNCLVPVNKEDSGVAPILLLDNLETVDIAQLFGELLDPMEYRGIGNTFCLRGDEKGGNGMHYLTDQFYVLGTMNKARSLGVDLSILPRFRWVQFRLDTEPLRGLLSRHFLRRMCNLYSGSLPGPLGKSADSEYLQDIGGKDSFVKEGSGPAVLRTVEWVVCVWQRLNDSLLKLGLPEVVVGPCLFFRCPLERRDAKLILEWMKTTWNQLIAPKVREAVRRGTGSDAPSEGQQKVANTALYVLMQRSVILGCPLTGQEKDVYLAGYAGSNELDIPLKSAGLGGGVAAGSMKSRSLLSYTSSGDSQPQQPGSNVSQRRPLSSGVQHMSRLSTTTTTRARSVGANDSHLTSLTQHSSPATGRVRARNGSREDQRTSDSSSSIKRRSLSDSNVDKAVKMEQQQQQQKIIDSLQQQSNQSGVSSYPKVVASVAPQLQAKVARLDGTAASQNKVISFTSAFSSPNGAPATTLSPQAWDNSPRMMTSSSSQSRKTGRVSPLLALTSAQKQSVKPSSTYKKSRSSENISGGGASAISPGRFRLSPGPFSFSLATPTSNLSSFKFLDKASSTPTGDKGQNEKVAPQDLTIPDFSVFDNVPTPTEEMISNRRFVFVNNSKEGDRGTMKNLGTDKEEVWTRIPTEDVWSKRTDEFTPSQEQDMEGQK